MFFTTGAQLSIFVLLGLTLVHESQEASSSVIGNAAISNSSNPSTDVRVGSSLAANAASSWLSPSGRFIFGFYREGDGFFVGIQLVVNPTKTMVVWTARPDMKLFPKDAVLNFTSQGFFLTPKRGASPLALFTFNSSASSAAMLDNGNFVVYSSNSSDIPQVPDVTLVGEDGVITMTKTTTSTTSTTNITETTATTVVINSPKARPNDTAISVGCSREMCGPYTRGCTNTCSDRPPTYQRANSLIIIWRSFDYPTDTILGSQSLYCNHSLTSSAGANGLSLHCDGNLVIYSITSGTVIWDSETSGENYNRLILNEDGRLYMSTSAGNQKDLSGYKPQNVETDMIYAATLGAGHIFRLYAVNLDANSTRTVNEIPYYKDQCQAKDVCGVDSYCWLANNNPECSCVPGFEYINKSANAGGCRRSRALPSCKITSSTGNILMDTVENILGLDDMAYSVGSAETRDDCRVKCAEDCDCYAAFFREQKCSKLKLPLTGGRQIPNDPGAAFIKVAVEVKPGNNSNIKRKPVVRVLAITVCALVAGFICLVGIAACGCAYWHLFGKFREQWRKWELVLAEEIAPRYFSYDEIPKEEIIGVGSGGKVYKATLPIGGHTVNVAVKVLHEGIGEDAEKSFKAEMSLIGRARHVNLLRLLGFCYDDINRVLVYEYMPRFSLAEHIFKTTADRPDWARRMKLLLGAARGIHYLHCECESKIIHGDIKPENILVSKTWTAKISDFGLAKQLSEKPTMASTATATNGMAVDENPKAEAPTEKVDVYSYGVVVLETVCGRRNSKDVDLRKEVRERMDQGEVVALWEGEPVEASKLERVVKMGMQCTDDDPDARPTMEEVVMVLEEVQEVIGIEEN